LVQDNRILGPHEVPAAGAAMLVQVLPEPIEVFSRVRRRALDGQSIGTVEDIRKGQCIVHFPEARERMWLSDVCLA